MVSLKSDVVPALPVFFQEPATQAAASTGAVATQHKGLASRPTLQGTNPLKRKRNEMTLHEGDDDEDEDETASSYKLESSGGQSSRLIEFHLSGH